MSGAENLAREVASVRGAIGVLPAIIFLGGDPASHRAAALLSLIPLGYAEDDVLWVDPSEGFDAEKIMNHRGPVYFGELENMPPGCIDALSPDVLGPSCRPVFGSTRLAAMQPGIEHIRRRFGAVVISG